MVEEFHFVDRLDERWSLCVSTLSQQAIRDAGVHEDDDDGYFVYLADRMNGRVRVLARAVTAGAAVRLVGVWVSWMERPHPVRA